MKNADTPYITIGKIGSTYGVQGWLKILSYTEYGASILEYSPWYLSDNQQTFEPIEIEDGRMHNKGVVVKIKGIDTPEQARLYTGKFISITRSQLPALEKEEYYWSDLEGCKVINQSGEVLGVVTYLIETGSNDVLVVKGDKEHAIPYLQGDVILRVDLEKHEIHVNWEPL